MKEHLRVKIKSLAAEARIIRSEEERVARRLQRDAERGLSSSKGTYAGHLALATLRAHRTVSVRGEARSALLALAVLRGMSYAQVEQSVRPGNDPDWGRVWSLVRKYGRAQGPEDTLEKRFLAFRSGEAITAPARALAA